LSFKLLFYKFIFKLGFSYNIRLTCDFDESSAIQNLFLDDLDFENNYEKIFSKNDFVYYQRDVDDANADSNNTLIKSVVK